LPSPGLKFAFAVTALASGAPCVSLEELRLADEATCAGYGFHPGTDAGLALAAVLGVPAEGIMVREGAGLEPLAKASTAPTTAPSIPQIPNTAAGTKLRHAALGSPAEEDFTASVDCFGKGGGTGGGPAPADSRFDLLFVW
jgi:hypothetical protein